MLSYSAAMTHKGPTFANGARRVLLLLSALALFDSSFLNIATAQQASALAVDDTLRIRSFPQWALFQFSPDGEWLAYAVENDRDNNHSGISSGGKGKDIWLLNIKTGEARNLTGNVGDSRLPKWSPNGQFLAFMSNRDASGHERLWIWDAAKNQLRKVSDISVREEWYPVEWTADSRSILVTTAPGKMPANISANRIDPGPKNQQTAGGPHDSTVLLYESPIAERRDKDDQDPTNLDIFVHNLVLVDVTTGQSTVVIDTERFTTHRLSPDGSRVAYTIPRRFEKPGQQMIFDLVVVTIATKRERLVAKDIRLWDEGDFSWSPDSLFLSYRVGSTFFGDPLLLSADQTFLKRPPGWTDRDLLQDCYVVSTSGGAPRNITHLSTPQRSIEYLSKMAWWDKTGNHIYFIANGAVWQASLKQDKATELAQIPGHRMSWRSLPQSTTFLETIDGGEAVVVAARDDESGQEGLFKINLTTGESAKLLEAGQCYTCAYAWDAYAVAPDGHHVAYIAEDAQHAYDLWLDDTTFSSPRRLTHLNPELDKHKLGSARVIDWLSADGERLHGALMLPSDYHEGQRYPLIVGVHGGEWLSKRFRYFGFSRPWSADLNMQLLATRGYVVFLPDSPLTHAGTPMADLAKAVLPGVNKVIDMGLADSGNLGLMGVNNGGGVDDVLALIVQTTRFKAAVDLGGAGDLIGLYGELSKAEAASEIDAIERVMGGTPWQVPERYIENSPFFYLNRVETPLLVLRDAQDGNALRFLGDQTFISLRRLGKEVEYAKYEGEGQSPGRYVNQLDFCNRVIAWFNKYLKPAPSQTGPQVSPQKF